jgi:uncharacterized protein YggE
MKMLAALGLAAVVLVAGVSGASTATAAQHSIVVTGDGSVTSVPDRAQISFGVSSDARTASAALRGNATEMAKVIAAIRGQGIAAADIRTESVSLSPRYSQNGESIIGYQAANSVSATIRNLGKAGAVIDAAVEAGANQVNGPNLTRGDQTSLYRAALRAAIANARGKAQTIAKVSGLHIRRIIGVTEASAAPPLPLTDTGRLSAPSTPIEPGTQVVQATVSVSFSVS